MTDLEQPAQGSLATEPGAPLYVVGVGASAGGLEALQRLFESAPRTGRFAFVVVQHLSPDFRSLMDEILAPHTKLAIHRVEDGMNVEADCIYLMPPKHEMIISGGRLLLSERDPARGLSLPIDSFFRSLAEDLGERGVAVVLSGTGSDGSRGVRAVHEAGGLVIAQSEASAKFTGMPRSAIDTGIVDMVLGAEEIGATLVKYAQQNGALAQPSEGRDVMSRMFELLRKESGIDFTDYKASTVGRRVERRLLLGDCRDLEQYVARLEHDGAEVRALYRDLLIGVTRFFRDPEAFERLRTELLPGLVERTPPGEELRLWIPACATGEEAYSLAILAAEAFRARGRPALLRVFATDVHSPSLEVASAGLYAPESLTEVAPELRERYFVRQADQHQVASELRGSVVFARHNVVRDAPFTRLDLLSCRNFLIYLKPQAQRRVLALFHFALKTGGVLLMGSSETPGPLAEEFSVVDTRWKIFTKRRDVRITPDVRLAPAGIAEAARPAPARQPSEDPRVTLGRQKLLERYLPPTLLIDESGRLLHSLNGAGELLAQKDGKPSLNLMDLLEGELRFVVSGALRRALKDRKVVVYGGVLVNGARDKRRLRIAVQSIGGTAPGEGCFSVVFEPEQDPAVVGEGGAARADVDELVKERLASLESELRLTKENLQATIEEMEASNEELQATNEELIASNEELQSTNEELHSVNEELYTVNAEHQTKIAELTEMTSDMNHFLEATEVHTIFLDRELRLRKFTPKIAGTFNLLPQDVGRRLDAFAHNLMDAEILKDLERVANSAETVQREIEDRRGRRYLLRILPYRSHSTTDGVVVTLIDISALKQARRELAVSEQRYRTLLRAITAILWTTDQDGRFSAPQAEWEAYTGHGWDVHQGDGWLAAIHEQDRERIRASWQAAVAERRLFEAEGRIYGQAAQGYRHFLARAAPLLDPDGGVREWVGHIVDVHDARMAELSARRKEAQIRAIVDNSPAFIWVKDPGGRYVVAGRQAEAVLGAPCAVVVGQTDHDFLPLAVADRLRASERRVLEAGETIESEEIVPTVAGLRVFLTVTFPLRDESGAAYAVAGISTDITERKRDAEEIKRGVERRDHFLAMLSHELRTPLGAIVNAVDLLEDGGDRGRSPAYARDIIRRQTRHMAKLIEDLLDVGRITRDQLVLHARLVDLRASLQEALEAAHMDVEQKGLVISAHLPDQPIPVEGDGARLRQIFTNLINNAIAYTPAGRIEVALRVEGPRVLVSVSDSGIGLTHEELARVFELFYQTPQALDRRRGGLGVGLTLALKLARMHGGDIGAESRGRHQGATFTVSLPLGQGAIVEAAPAPRARPSRKLRLVVIEDNDDIRETLVDLLQCDEHEVLSAREGKRGAALIMETRPDVAIVDVGLPGMDGYTVARAVREQCGSAVRLIALTGYGRREDRQDAEDAGFDRHIVKPVDHEVLAETLSELTADPPDPRPPARPPTKGHGQSEIESQT